MFSITPFAAERQIYKSVNGGMTSAWEQCRAIGITMVDNESLYIIECSKRGESWLETESVLRRTPPQA
jgi:hypothetical protein